MLQTLLKTRYKKEGVEQSSPFVLLYYKRILERNGNGYGKQY